MGQADHRTFSLGRPDLRPKAVVAEPDEKILAATCEILRREKFNVTACREGAELLNLCKTLVPALLMVDVAMPGVDVTQTVRVLQRCRETQPVRLVGICPRDYDELHRSSLKSQGAFAVLQRPMKRKDILATAAAALVSSNEQRATLAAATAKRPPRARVVESSNALLARKVLCPFHDEPVTFDRYALRSGKIMSELNFFDLPVYTAATPGTEFVNFHALATIVCPTCLFATSHAGYFKDTMDPASAAFPFSEATRRAIREAASERIHQAGADSMAFASPSRSMEQALVAGALSLGCSQVLYDGNSHGLNIETARMANARLRNAHLRELLGRPMAEIDREYRAALELSGVAFSTVRGSAVYRVAYQAMALSIRFREDRAAFQYLGALRELERDPALPAEERSILMRYLPRCQTAWTERDQHRSPAIGAAPAVSNAA